MTVKQGHQTDRQATFTKSVKEYEKRTPKSRQSHLESLQFMPGGDTRTTVFHAPYPLTVKQAQGCKLYDIDGNEYIDFLNNYTAMVHGHSHPEITRTAQQVIQEGSAYAARNLEQIELAQMLSERVPSIEKIRFCNSGTEATMFAIRAARAFTGKSGIIKMTGGYHGTHDAVEYSVHPPVTLITGSVREPIPDGAGLSVNTAKDVFVAPFNDGDVIERILVKYSSQIACIIVEPVMGVAGVIPPRPDYLTDLRTLADRYGVLLIFDEVQTLRLDWGGAQARYGVTPDLTAIGKIIGGGFPVGAFGGRSEIMDLFDPSQAEHLSHGGTFNGNRVTMASGVMAMRLLDKTAIQFMETRGQQLVENLWNEIRKNSVPASVTHIGSMLNVHFTETPPVNYETTATEHHDLSQLMHLELLNRGIMTAPRGMWNLSTVMTEEQIKDATRAFSEVMRMVAAIV